MFLLWYLHMKSGSCFLASRSIYMKGRAGIYNQGRFLAVAWPSTDMGTGLRTSHLPWPTIFHPGTRLPIARFALQGRCNDANRWSDGIGHRPPGCSKGCGERSVPASSRPDDVPEFHDSQVSHKASNDNGSREADQIDRVVL